MPKVSVVMNCFNGQEYLKEALDSVFSQTVDDWEVIFVDNCSTDKSVTCRLPCLLGNPILIPCSFVTFAELAANIGPPFKFLYPIDLNPFDNFSILFSNFFF